MLLSGLERPGRSGLVCSVEITRVLQVAQQQKVQL